MVRYVETLVSKLELPYRIVRLCGGDISFTSALTFDFEVFSAAQERWLEVSSVSNFESFQANRLKCRFKGEDGKIAIRNIRRKAMEQLKKLQKDGDAGEDEVIAAEKEMEKITSGYIETEEKLVENKENELMEV